MNKLVWDCNTQKLKREFIGNIHLELLRNYSILESKVWEEHKKLNVEQKVVLGTVSKIVDMSKHAKKSNFGGRSHFSASRGDIQGLVLENIMKLVMNLRVRLLWRLFKLTDISWWNMSKLTKMNKIGHDWIVRINWTKSTKRQKNIQQLTIIGSILFRFQCYFKPILEIT